MEIEGLEGCLRLSAPAGLEKFLIESGESRGDDGNRSSPRQDSVVCHIADVI